MVRLIFCLGSSSAALRGTRLIGQGVQGRFGISSVEFCDDRHTLLPVFFIALPPVLGPLLRALLPSHLTLPL
jgi:hypothetical protein